MSAIFDPSTAPRDCRDPQSANDEGIAIFVRLLTMGWLDPELATDRMMQLYAVKLAHYVRKARMEQERIARLRQVADELGDYYGVRKRLDVEESDSQVRR